MEEITETIQSGEGSAEVTEMQQALISLGAAIAPAEQNGETYGPSTLAAVHAFQQQFGLPVADTLDPSTGRLMNVAATFAGAGDPAALRDVVREAAADTSQPQELYWLARYATLAGDYETAQSI